jgi:superfamily II DNA/RNA helicase
MEEQARPDFVDNREGNTLATALTACLRAEREAGGGGPALWLATAYFKPEAFPLLGEELEQASAVRLLLGAPPPPRPPRPRGLGEPVEKYQASLVEEGLRALRDGLTEDINLLGFSPEVDDMLRRLIAFLRSEAVEVRLYTPRFLHGKAFVFPLGNGVIVGSSNFTPGGLATNLELNLGRYEPEPVGKVKQWFEDLWAEAESFDLAAIYEARFEEYPPYLIYLRVLWELYGHELGEPFAEGIPLTDFQKDGLVRARRIVRDYTGVLVADGVGLGKTYIAGELIRQTVYQQRQRALLIAPAPLRDGTWATFFDHYDIHCDAISYEQLGQERLLGGDGGSYLKFDPREYALVVIDEAQAFRNPNTRRADALRRLLSGDPPKQVVMLSATPVNNTLWDLYYMLNQFVGHDAVFADRGIFSLQERFKAAAAIDPYELRPDVLFDVLDAICVRRTRHFVRKWYPNASILDTRGNVVPVRFPKPRPLRVEYSFDRVLPGFFDRLEEALMPEEGPPKLTMARYMPSRYRLGPAEKAETVEDTEARAEPHERQLVGLLRSALLKRFESSVHSFARTAERLVKAHEGFLRALGQGYVASAKALAELEDVDNDEALEELLSRHEGAEIAAGYDVEGLRSDVERDRALLARFAKEAGDVSAQDDPKLQMLLDQLGDIVKQGEQDGLDEEDKRNKRKVLIFTYYADTVEWIQDYLERATHKDKRLNCYRGRMASVTSDDSRGGVSRKEAIYGFAPVSTEAPPGESQDRFDILVCTDVLAEGMNLQQCRHVINYDLPWNPMRIVQRNGRIDRIGSNYDQVFARCFFPEKRLEDLLELEGRIRRKLAQAAASVGVEEPPVPGAPVGRQVFTETREQIESLLREDPTLLVTAGEGPWAYSGEEYRQELSSGMSKYGEQVKALAWAAGSGYQAEGKRTGWAFCVRVGDRVLLRFVPADGGEVEKDTLACLKEFTCEEGTERHLPEEARQGAYEAWQKAKRHIYEEWMRATDPANLQPEVPRIFRLMAEHLRRYPPAGMPAPEVDDVLDRLEAPWPRRIQNAFREVFDPEEEPSDPYAASGQVVDMVKKLGLQPFRPPQPLPPIEEDQIMLVCWTGVDSA